MRSILAVMFVALLASSTAYAQASGSDFVLMETNHVQAQFAGVWLNLRHMHSLQPCRAGSQSLIVLACAHMDDHLPSSNNRRFFSRKPYEQAVRGHSRPSEPNHAHSGYLRS